MPIERDAIFKTITHFKQLSEARYDALVSLARQYFFLDMKGVVIHEVIELENIDGKECRHLVYGLPNGVTAVLEMRKDLDQFRKYIEGEGEVIIKVASFGPEFRNTSNELEQRLLELGGA